MENNKQETEWGYVQWVHMADDSSDKGAMSVGLVTMFPHTRAKRHIHYGQEQMLYVLSGSGTYFINDEEFRFNAGDYFVMKADVSHETINDTDNNVVELLVSVPVGMAKVKSGRTDNTFDELASANEKEKLYKAVSYLKTQISNISDLPFTVFDTDRNVLMQSEVYPEICVKNCDPAGSFATCECFCTEVGDCDVEDRWLSCTCSHGMKTFLCPVSFEGKLIGMVRGGHFFTSEKGVMSDNDEYDVPITAQIAIRSVLDQIVDTIESYVTYLASVENLKEKEKRLVDTAAANEMLQKDLGEITEQVTNLKINHHFLFNTLNCMSAMALDGDRYDMYQSVIDLSKMFRYTMTAELKMMTLKQEVEYLRSYLNLQKLRYKDGLEITYDIDESCLDTLIPFNFLQPIVENAFTHGFMSYDDKKYIDIKIKDEGERVMIDMHNNGIPPAEADLYMIKRNWESKNGHGLALIYEKLEKCYGADFNMDISTPEGKGTILTVELPKEK